MVASSLVQYGKTLSSSEAGAKPLGFVSGERNAAAGNLMLPPWRAAAIRAWQAKRSVVGKAEKIMAQPKAAGQAASRLISERIAELADWRGATLAKIRALIRQADPDVVEEWKWRGTPVWSHDGGICTGESYKSVVKLTFFKGASLKDPAKLFNASLDGNVRRAIDIHEGEEIDADAFKALIRAAVALNTSGGKKLPKRR
jgi:hypothetical protein